MDLIRRCNDWNPADFHTLIHVGRPVGLVDRRLAQILRDRCHFLFERTDDDTLLLALPADPTSANVSLSQTHRRLAEEGLMPHPAGEGIDVVDDDQRVLFQADVALAAHLGLMTRGANVVLRYPNSDYLVAKRNRFLKTYPGRWDVPAGGLIPAGRNAFEQAMIEMREETGIAEADVRILTGPFRMRHTRRRDCRDPTLDPVTPGIERDEATWWIGEIADGTRLVPQPEEVETHVRLASDQLLASLIGDPEDWKPNAGVILLQVAAADPGTRFWFTREEIAALDSMRNWVKTSD